MFVKKNEVRLRLGNKNEKDGKMSFNFNNKVYMKRIIIIFCVIFVMATVVTAQQQEIVDKAWTNVQNRPLS